MKNHDFDSSVVTVTAHRPWPMPREPWVFTQTWNDLLFAHWRVDADALRARIPAPFEPDLFEGEAWLGVIPFEITNIAPRGVPSMPGISAFPEINVRTYVRVVDRAGVLFFSLDAGSTLAVRAARAVFNLPYYRASMAIAREGDGVRYRSARRWGAAAAFAGHYAPDGAVFKAAPGSLEHFLTERYCFYHHDRRGAPYRLDIHHRPWPLQPATATIDTNTMAEANDLSVIDTRPLLHFARRLDVVAWMPRVL